MLLLIFSAFAVPSDNADGWYLLQSSPVKIECIKSGTKNYCRSTGVIGVQKSVASDTFAHLDQHLSQMGAITAIDRLEPDVLHIVMDYPYPLSDRDYVARFTLRHEGETDIYAWSPIESASAPPKTDVVRLTWLDGEWRFAPEGNNTRVTYVWEADPGGNLPDVSAVWRKAGLLAIQDMANACGTKLVGN